MENIKFLTEQDQTIIKSIIEIGYEHERIAIIHVERLQHLLDCYNSVETALKTNK